MTSDGNEENRHSGFFTAPTDNKAWGRYANGTGFEQAVAFRAFTQPLAVGDSFSFVMENGKSEKKFETDGPATGSIGLTLRAGNGNDSPALRVRLYEGKDNYQIYDGTGADKTDSGVIVTVTITGEDSYDLEIQTAVDKKPRSCRAGSSPKPAPSAGLRCSTDGEKTDAFFNSLQVARENK